MRIVIQRVSEASVAVDGEIVGSIGVGLCLLVGIGQKDSAADVETAVAKITTLRIFRDDKQKMNRSLTDVGGEILVVSQFTLLGDLKKGRRPSFVRAAPPEVAEPLIEMMVAGFMDRGIEVATGQFGTMMDVSLVNDGPVTVLLDVTDGRVSSS